jgi:uncharacterized protein (DUF1919 family)
MRILAALAKKAHTTFLKRRISVISNNCIGGVICKDLGIRHNSPTTNLFLFFPDYLAFLRDLSGYLAADLVEANASKYGGFTYPIGLLKDLEIHFPHDTEFSDAKHRWNRRRRRFSKRHLYVVGCYRDLCTDDLVEQFSQLPYRKVFFSHRPFPHLKDVVFFPEYTAEDQLPDLIPNREWNRYFRPASWLNLLS